MKILATALVIGAVFLNFSAQWALPGFSPYATWYIEQSYWVMILCLIVRWLINDYPKTPVWLFAATACWIGAFEGFQNGTCRLFVINPRDIPPGKTVCDFVTGLPIQATSITMYLLLFLWGVYRCRMIRRTS